MQFLFYREDKALNLFGKNKIIVTDDTEYRKKNLLIIKIIHTAVWIFYNFVLIYLFYAVLNNKIDKWLWLGMATFVVEVIVLVIFKMVCPLTIIARKYSDSSKANFDIFLPVWLAKNNKLIYSILLALFLIVLIYRLV